jgi:ABC-type hemin transport system ATPase subunit
VTHPFDILRRVNAEGAAILLVEQFVPLALANTDRALVLAKGEVTLSGPSADLAEDPALLASYLGTGAADTPPADGSTGPSARPAAGPAAPGATAAPAPLRDRKEVMTG